MDKNEFINKIIGAKWVNRAVSFEACDCWGVVVLYYKHVLNIELPVVIGYKEKINISDCWQEESSKPHWLETDNASDSGLVFTCYKGDLPSHVGVTIGNGMVLHSNGTNKSGGAQVNSIRAIQAIYGKMTYHKYIELNNASTSN